MKPIWKRYEWMRKEEGLLGFRILLGATVLSLLGVFLFNVVCLVFVIVFGLFAGIFLQGYARPYVENLLDEARRAHKAEKEFSVPLRTLSVYFMMLASPFYFAWQLCSLLLILGVMWENPINVWFMTSFPTLFISTFILIPWREKWKDLGGSAKKFWRLHALVYLGTLLVAAAVFLILLLIFGEEFFTLM